MKVKATPLNWLSFIMSGLVIVSGWDGLLHFPDPFPGSANPTIWDSRITYLWPFTNPPFPVPAPILVMLMATSLLAWLMRRAARKTAAFTAMVTGLTLGTILIPLTFIHYSLSGTGWIDTPRWYWIWLMAFGTISTAWFGRQISLARDP